MAGSSEDAARSTTSTSPAGGGIPGDQAGGGDAAGLRAGALDALLALAGALTRLSGIDEIAGEVARASLSILGVSRAAVLVWDAEDGLLVRLGEAEAGVGVDGTGIDGAGIHGAGIHGTGIDGAGIDGAGIDGTGIDGTGARGGATGAVASARGAAPASAPLPPSTVAAMVRRPAALPLRSTGSGILQTVGQAAGIGDGTVVPLVAAGDLLGVLVLASAPGRAAGSAGGEDDDGARMLGLVGLAATGLGNAQLLSRLRHQAEHDPLTGLPTLRLVERLGVSGLADARRRGAAVVVLFVDLDGFHAVNDRLGHAAGDRLLTQVAGRLRAAVRGADIVGRVGGDEFVVVLTQVGHLAGGQAVAERVVRSLGEPFALDGVILRVGATVGVALTTPQDLSLAGPLARADAAMARAKRAGRGLVGLDQGTVVEPALSGRPAGAVDRSGPERAP